MLIPPTNQVTITTWKKQDHGILSIIWDCVDNSIFSYIGAPTMGNETWLVFKNTYFASNTIT